MKHKIKLTTEEVKHVAKLANLDLTDQEVNQFQEQLSEVLDYVEILKEVSTDKVEPTSQVTSLENVLREDEPGDSLSQKDVLSGAKKTHEGRFQIKRILNND
jgi:aspartyl-tRNA(Asn)/glutamyl-tRNA(Gln) amidotransferase subunit C